MTTKQYILAGPWLGAECLQVGGSWECSSPPRGCISAWYVSIPVSVQLVQANGSVKAAGREELKMQRWILCRWDHA